MKLKKLLKDLPAIDVKGSKEIEITGVCSNSRFVGPGNLFIARKGATVDGSRFIPEAVSAGASAVLTDIFDPTLRQVVQLISPRVSELEGILASRYYGHPSRELFIVGITGTNGKTTTAYIVKHLLEKTIGRCGLIGTIEYMIGNHSYRPTHTTPDVSTNHKLLKEMVAQDCKAAVMEATSHALVQRRVDQIGYDAAIFTNLTLDHLDYHKTMEAYCDAKRLLFRSLDSSAVAIFNADSEWSGRMAEGCRAERMTYGIENNADLRASHVVMSASGTEVDVACLGRTYRFSWPLIGRFNMDNCLAAIALGLSKNIPVEAIQEAMRTIPPIPGRMERIPNPLGLNIYVDFAHSDDALNKVLNCLHPIKDGRIITVFGCGGDRDRTKRPKMAAAAERFSDLSIVTSDNPRSEDPRAIVEEVVAGFVDRDKWTVEVDRREAIRKAIGWARPDDIVLIAGRGHEPYQSIAHQTIEFDDRLVAKEIANGKI